MTNENQPKGMIAYPCCKKEKVLVYDSFDEKIFDEKVREIWGIFVCIEYVKNKCYIGIKMV